MVNPAYTAEEARSRETFLALMWSMSYPGRIYTLPAQGLDAFAAIGDTLLDLETSFYTPDAVLAGHLGRNGARHLEPERASYHFYLVLQTHTLETVKQASIGTLLYPDQSATLIIGCQFGTGAKFQLTGPGIPANTSQTIEIAGIPDEFWSLRASANRYPRGWDIMLVADGQVISLPRTTEIRVED